MRTVSYLSRSLVAAAAVAGTIVLAAAPAATHALAQASEPAAGATLKQAPAAVRITFGETPDAKLSRIGVLDASGNDRTKGGTEVIPGDPRTLTVGLGPLSDGVYTVSWRTVSRVDGHLAAGTFSFGVGVSPSATATAGFATSSATPSVAGVGARWLLYVGLMGVLGGAFVGVWCFEAVPRRLGGVLAGAWVLGAIGTIGITAEARREAGLSWSRLWGSSLGDQLGWRAGPVLAVLVLLVLGRRRERGRWGPGGPGRGVLGGGGNRPARKAVLALSGIAALVAMWGDVESGHVSAARSFRLLRMTDQWIHFAAAGIWIGGLVALLVTVSTVVPEERARAGSRYSRAALISVVVVSATGVQRAFDEIGSVHRLVHAAFGQLVLVKVALLGVLIGLGAINRYRSLPRIGQSQGLLRAVGRAELLVMGGVLAATGVIQGLAPPATVAAASSTSPLVLTGHDFATTVRVRLTVSPGIVGFNQFALTVADYDSGAPIAASASLGFTIPARPGLGMSSLPLRAVGPGVFSAGGANLSLNGTYAVVVTLQRPTGGTQIPFTVTPRPLPQKIRVQPQGSGLPTLYTLDLAAGQSVQTYLDPARPGLNEFHVTFFGADGQELSMTACTVDATAPAGTSSPLTVRHLDTLGHYVADLEGAVKGSYQFRVSGSTASGSALDGTFTIGVY